MAPGKQLWTGIGPSPDVYKELDFEQITVLAHIAWCSGTRNPLMMPDVAAIPGAEDEPLGMANAVEIIDSLMEMRICSVRGHHNPHVQAGARPASVLLGGFQRNPAPHPEGRTVGQQGKNRPLAHPAERSVSGGYTGSSKPQAVGSNPTEPWRRRGVSEGKEDWILLEDNFYVPPSTPPSITRGFLELRKKVAEAEAAKMEPVAKVETMYALAQERVILYKRLLRFNPKSEKVQRLLDKKRVIAKELKRQVENARAREAAKRL